MNQKTRLAKLLSTIFLLATWHAAAEQAKVSDDAIITFCGSCHRSPDPGILPKHVWSREIIRMYEIAYEMNPQTQIPPLDTVTEYYVKKAPEKLHTPSLVTDVASIQYNLESIPSPAVFSTLSHVEHVDFIAENKGKEIIASDMFGGSLYWLGKDLVPHKIATVRYPGRFQVTDFDQDGTPELLVAGLGWQGPTDAELGGIFLVRQRGQNFESMTIAGGLGRVADAQAVDIDSDGDMDVVAAVFGMRKSGELLLLENISDPAKKNQLALKPLKLDDRPGAISAVIADFNGDKKPDIATVFSQEHEVVVVYFNRGKNIFSQQELFRAPHPNWGFNSIKAADVDGDNRLDLLMTNGDSMDDAVPLKPDHGVAYLKNEGGERFTYRPIGKMYGATHAEVTDVDHDGDMDVIASAWFSGAREREEVRDAPALVLFEKTKDDNFKPYILMGGPGEYPTFEVRDDQNGQLDLILGRFLFREDKADTSMLKLLREKRATTPN